MVLKLYGWLQQNTLRMMILMKYHTNKTKLNKLIQVKPLQLFISLTRDQTYVMKISSVQHDFANVVNVVGIKMEPKPVVHTAYVE